MVDCSPATALFDELQTRLTTSRERTTLVPRIAWATCSLLTGCRGRHLTSGEGYRWWGRLKCKAQSPLSLHDEKHDALPVRIRERASGSDYIMSETSAQLSLSHHPPRLPSACHYERWRAPRPGQGRPPRAVLVLVRFRSVSPLLPPELTRPREDSTLKLNGRNFKILRLIGDGGFSEVYLAQDLASSRLFALKKIRCQLGAESVRTALKEVEGPYFSLDSRHER